MSIALDLSDKFVARLRKSSVTQREIGEKLGKGYSQSEMSKLMHRYEGQWRDKNWRMKIVEIGKFLGLTPEECFQGGKRGTQSVNT